MSRGVILGAAARAAGGCSRTRHQPPPDTLMAPVEDSLDYVRAYWRCGDGPCAVECGGVAARFCNILALFTYASFCG